MNEPRETVLRSDLRADVWRRRDVETSGRHRNCAPGPETVCVQARGVGRTTRRLGWGE